MIKILTKSDSCTHATLFDQMFHARAEVFQKRLRWNINVIDDREIDHYDEFEDPVYIMMIDEHDIVSGSLRVLPTTGPTMLKHEFRTFFDEPVDVECPTVWECTRFCVHPSPPGRKVRPQVSNRLLIGLCELCLSSGVEQVVGVYDNSMNRVYDRIGWTPTRLAIARHHDVALGTWKVSKRALEVMRGRLHQCKEMEKFL